MRKNTNTITFTDEEAKKIKDASKRVGLTFASFLRTCALEKSELITKKND